MVHRNLIPAILLILLINVFGYGQVQLEPVCVQSIEKYGVNGYPGSEFVWSVKGGTILDGDGTDTVIVQWGNQQDAAAYLEVIEYTATGCFNVPSTATIIVRGKIVDLGTENFEICAGESHLFDAGSGFENDYIITWQDGSNDQTYIGDSTEKIKVTVIDGFGCRVADSINLIVNSLPEVNLGNDTILCDDENPLMIYYSQIMKYPENFSSAEWIVAGERTFDNYVSLSPAVEGIDTLIVKITDINECQQKDTMHILPCDLEIIFKNMPNTITPDGNGQNDVWNILPFSIPNTVLEIFDRWGRLVYHTENVFEEPWDGKSQGRPLPMDAYYFVIKVSFGSAKPLVKTGTVNLIK